MTASASWELQKDIVTALRADATLQGFIGQRVFDYLPRDTILPYVVYDEGSMTEWDVSPDGSVSGDGKEHLISIHVFDDQEGTKRVRETLQRCHELIQNQTFALVNHNLVNLRFLIQDVIKDPDGQIYHGIAQYRAITEET